MALIFCDGFDHYATAQINNKWTSSAGATVAAVGREGNGAQGDGVTSGAMLQKGIASTSALIVGMALRVASLPTVANPVYILQFLDGGQYQCELALDPSGALAVYVATTTGPSPTGGALVVKSAGGIVSINNFVYVEISVVLSKTATGSVFVRANGQLVASATNVVTAFSASNSADSLNFALASGTGANNRWILDDVYVCDSTGTTNNTFLGDVKIATALPSGNGRVNQFARTGGTASGNYTAVNEVPPDGDTSYVSSSTAGATDCYLLSSLGTVTNVVAVQIVGDVRKDDSGTRIIGLGFGNGTTESYGANLSPGNNYAMLTQPFDQNPVTAAPWAPSDLTSGQIAVTVIS